MSFQIITSPILESAGRQDEAEAEFRQAINLHEKAMLNFPNGPELKVRPAMIRGELANLLRGEGKSAEAEVVSK